MTDNQQDRKLVDRLVSQDPAVAAFPFEEFRMDLERKLNVIERRAGAVRRASLIASAAAVAFCPLAVVTSTALVQLLCAICFYVALITAGVLLSLYWHMYRPAADRARSDLQLSMIADLQRQIAKLIERLDNRDE